MRTAIWLIRHAQTTWNRARRYQGRSDPPLTAYGQQQAAALAHHLRRLPFTVAVVSPSTRATATAAAMVAGRAGVVWQPDAAWRETDHGTWEGLTYHEVLQRNPAEVQARFGAGIDGRAPGGESLREVGERVLAGWRAVLREHAGGRVLLVTHATPIQVVLCSVTGMPLANHWQWRIDNASVTALDVYGDAAIIRRVNEVPPLLSAARRPPPVPHEEDNGG